MALRQSRQDMEEFLDKLDIFTRVFHVATQDQIELQKQKLEISSHIFEAILILSESLALMGDLQSYLLLPCEGESTVSISTKYIGC